LTRQFRGNLPSGVALHMDTLHPGENGLLQPLAVDGMAA
jgi:hypothetical protein